MATEPKSHPQPPEDPHDDREIEVKGLLRLGVLLALVTAAAMGLMWVFAVGMQREERVSHNELPPIARMRSATPPEPRLQPRPPEGLAALRAREEEALGRYRWVDAERGVVGIPIDRAIELMLQRPPPSRDQAQVPEGPRSSVPTQSSLGEWRREQPVDSRPRGEP